MLTRAAETGRRNGLADAAAGMLALMSSGATAAAHLSTGGFDTHDNHDDKPPSGAAPAARWARLHHRHRRGRSRAQRARRARGRGSDFGRTRYNDGGGKDHWPITSMMAIGIGAAEKLVPGARVIGATDPSGQNGVVARRVKVSQGSVVVTEEGDPDGFKLTPAHVQLALRNAHRAVRDRHAGRSA